MWVTVNHIHTSHSASYGNRDSNLAEQPRPSAHNGVRRTLVLERSLASLVPTCNGDTGASWQPEHGAGSCRLDVGNPPRFCSAMSMSLLGADATVASGGEHR
jgi:hypothetical protein